MDVKMTNANGQETILSSERFITQDVVVSPITINRKRSEVEMRAGLVQESAQHGSRTITLHLLFIAKDHSDFDYLQSRAFDLFTDLAPYHLHIAIPRKTTSMYGFELPGQSWGEEVNFLPSEVAFLCGKRYHVVNSQMSDVAQDGLLGKFTVTLETFSHPYAESSGTVRDLLEWDTDLWQWGQGLDWGELKYRFTSSSFNVVNAGNVAIDPRESELVIKVKGVGSQVQIRNLTTGDVYVYHGALTANDTLEINGIYTKKNGVLATRDTNKQLLSLAPLSLNRFSVSGLMNPVIEFDYRFKYR